MSSILGAGRTTSLALPSSMIATRERRIIQSTFIFLCMYRLYRHTFWWNGGFNLIEWVPMSMGWWLVPHGTKKGFLLSRLSLLTSLKRPFLGRLPRTTGCELSLLDTATETVWFRTAPLVRLLSCVTFKICHFVTLFLPPINLRGMKLQTGHPVKCSMETIIASGAVRR